MLTKYIFEAILHTTMGRLSPKTITKQFYNNFQTTQKKSKFNPKVRPTLFSNEAHNFVPSDNN